MKHISGGMCGGERLRISKNPAYGSGIIHSVLTQGVGVRLGLEERKSTGVQDPRGFITSDGSEECLRTTLGDEIDF
jgi:hypothetical protein